MGWFRLETAPTVERALQDVFDAWGTRPSTCTVVGVPDWLRDLGVPETRSSFELEGYRFHPDVVWTTHVAELKCAVKYEPLALAEGLHHAQCLSVMRERAITPILVTSYSAYMRRALEFLFSHGVEAETIRYVEVGHLHAPSTQEQFMWFDAPFAAWKGAERLPGCIPQDAHKGHWYYVHETRTWCRISAERRERPLVPDGPTVLVSDVGDGRYVYWSGSYDQNGQYFLYDEGSDGDSAPPSS